MGGFGSGGQAGVGRKPKSRQTATLHGSRQRGTVPRPRAAKPHAVPMPAYLPEGQADVWRELAPLAIEQFTLTPATAGSFRELCAAIVTARFLLDKINADGWTFTKVSVDGAGVEHTELKKHPLVADHRAWVQRVEAGRARFRLAPVGKEIAAPTPDADPFEEFDRPDPTVQ